ncbi:MAG: aminoacetone oxidase family FAD-binding enzyme [bacterium]
MIKKDKKPNIWDVVVIGGGPAGLMSASIAAKFGAKTLLIEKNDVMGKKLLLTGGGRCNLTNADPDERNFVSKFGKKGNFLFTPLSVFGTDDTVRFFESLGMKTKVEAGYRVFPETNNAMDVLGILTKFAKNNGVEFRLGIGVAHIKKSGGLSLKRSKATGKGETSGHIESVILEDGSPEKILPDGKSNIFPALDKKSNASGKTLTGIEIKGKNFILATGGKSRPETGSTGDGLKWLKELGHKVADANPSLVPIKVKENWVSGLAGITLENIGVSVWQDSKKVLNNKNIKQNKILFTHNGLSGPIILNMSKNIGELLKEKKEIKIAIDFFSGIGLDIMNEKIINLFEKNPKKKIKNLLFPEVPEKIYLKILNLLGINGEFFVGEIKRIERTSIVEKFKKFELTADSLLGYDKAIVSSGGVASSEVDFKEMKSKLYNNLFLVGDILDFDRASGGFSLQLCWTSGYIAGKIASFAE